MSAKKTAYTALALLIIFGAVLMFLEYRNKGKDYESKFQKAVVAAVEKSLDKQMPDWETTLRNTSSTTAGNWQDSKVANQNPNDGAPLTETDKFARSFFEQYLLMRGNKNGADLNESEKAALVSSMIEEAPIADPTPEHKLADLNIIPDTSDSAIKTYGNNMGKIMADNSLSSSDHELLIFEKALNTDDPKELEKLEPILKSYKSVLDGLLKIPVPESLSQSHLDLVIAMEYMVKCVDSFKLVFTDPLKSMNFVRFYPQAVNLYTNAYKKIIAYINLRKINFNKNEFGFRFVQTI